MKLFFHLSILKRIVAIIGVTITIDNIVSLCQHENVELIILNTPLHPYYRSKIPEEFFSL